MCHAALLAVTLLARSFAAEAASTPERAVAPPAAPIDDALGRLPEPAAIDDLSVSLEMNGGVLIELRYALPDVGEVAITVRGADDGSGLGRVKVDDAVVVEVPFVAGAPAAERVDMTSLRPEQAHALVASVVQVWHDNAVTEALAATPIDDRDFKCTLAGQIAGAVSGVGVLAACELLVKNPVTCGKAGGGAWANVAVYITNKCNGGQNK